MVGVPVVGGVLVVLSGVGDAPQRHFTAGLLTATAFWMPLYVNVIRTYSATTGQWGEDFTREALTARRLHWRVIDDLPMHRFNIDHVAITPAAVLAVETKFRGAAQASADRHKDDLDAAHRSARSTRLLLASANVRAPASVQPVLMLWGPGARVDGGHRYDDGVLVVQGCAKSNWQTLFANPVITPVQASDIERGLRRYQEKRDKYDRDHAGRDSPAPPTTTATGPRRTRQRPA